ncbi:hypothetical protein CQW23_25653 [Capsicum baccatum]|uniref:Uncharacterized protein n=1 Tax=Capsicum baccatum TaxID=33114 RepID=A0A2G2VLL2_CAPBA|nr:hypothetical protein CQW23_25653 [Capsicum baccatum]
MDERDGSVFAAVLEWDQTAALADFIPIRPIGSPKMVYKALAAKRTHVEAHLFNPPSISLAMSLRILSGKAGCVWKRFKSMLPSNSEYQSRSVVEGAAEATE